MSANTSSRLSLPKTPLDYIAEGYWQDFLVGQPVAGGIAYEGHLHECQLDESLMSLQRLDILILQIRRDIMKAGALDDAKILADERYRNLLLFLAFYTGRVLARQWQQSPRWYGAFELRTHYPHVPRIADDFYQHMAVVYHNNENENTSTPLFFALEPIGQRLFGHIDRPFVAVQGGQIASGLYQAVIALLPESCAINSVTNGNTDTNANANANVNTNTNTVASTSSPTIPTPVLPLTHPKQEPVATIAIGTDKGVGHTNPTETTRAPQAKKSALPTPEIFKQLLIELDEIEVVQTAGISDYHRACKVLDQFEHHINKQTKPRAEVIFSASHQHTRVQALTILQQAATLGHTAAMLRLGMYELLGEGLNKDDIAAKEAGVNEIKRAANNNDARAQRLLSKMYYQGIGVPQDMAIGKNWLEQAAKNGHAEAANIVEQWQQAQALITTQKQEQHSIKRYQLLIAVVAVAALLLIIFV